MGAMQALSLTKYTAVRSVARSVLESSMKRCPSVVADLCAPAVRALRATPEDEDRCIAACAVLKTSASVAALRRDPRYFRAVIEALMGSSHHGGDKSQSAVNELFLSIAIRFSQGGFGSDRPVSDTALPPDLVVTRDGLFAMLHSASSRGSSSGADGCDKGEHSSSSAAVSSPPSPPPSALHWRYAIMANTILLFLISPTHTTSSELVRFVQHLVGCIAGDVKALRLPAVCALLMLSRCANFNEAGASALRAELERPGAVELVFKNLALCHVIIDTSQVIASKKCVQRVRQGKER